MHYNSLDLFSPNFSTPSNLLLTPPTLYNFSQIHLYLISSGSIAANLCDTRFLAGFKMILNPRDKKGISGSAEKSGAAGREAARGMQTKNRNLVTIGISV